MEKSAENFEILFFSTISKRVYVYIHNHSLYLIRYVISKKSIKSPIIKKQHTVVKNKNAAPSKSTFFDDLTRIAFSNRSESAKNELYAKF